MKGQTYVEVKAKAFSWRELAVDLARQTIIDCHALMDMDAEQTARCISSGWIPEDMRRVADALTEAKDDTAAAGLMSAVAEALAELADAKEDGCMYLTVREGGETQC